VGDGFTPKGGEMGGGYQCESAGGKEKAAQEGGTHRRRIQLEPSETSGLCLGITRHPCDKVHALFVRQPSAAEGCEKMGRRRRKSDVGRRTRRRYQKREEKEEAKKEIKEAGLLRLAAREEERKTQKLINKNYRRFGERGVVELSVQNTLRRA